MQWLGESPPPTEVLDLERRRGVREEGGRRSFYVKMHRYNW